MGTTRSDKIINIPKISEIPIYPSKISGLNKYPTPRIKVPNIIFRVLLLLVPVFLKNINKIKNRLKVVNKKIKIKIKFEIFVKASTSVIMRGIIPA